MKKLILLTLVFIFGIILLSGCKNMDKNKISLNLFEHGVKKVFTIESKSEREEIVHLVTELVKGTDDMLRLLVDKKRINELKNTEIGIEIIFPKKVMLTSDKIGEFEVDKLYIPFTGDFIGKGDDTMSTIFMANGAYISGPLRNSKGRKMVKQIQTLLKN